MARRFGAAPFFIALVLGGAFAYQQFLAGVVLREYAAPQAWPTLVSTSLASDIDEGEPLFASRALQVQLARRALDDGELALATRRVAQLPSSLERDALRGRLEERAGNRSAATADFLAAGDRDGVERQAQSSAQAGRIDDALDLEGRLVVRLDDDPGQVDALADTWLSIGRLDQEQAAAWGVTTPSGRAAAQRSADAYARAVALAPLSERYLLPAGTQALNLGDLDLAERYFTQAREADPSAAEAYAGLGEVARRRGDRALARTELSRAQQLGPQLPAVRRLAQELER
jgi:tetratricopeptide (TPR) repeat protein